MHEPQPLLALVTPNTVLIKQSPPNWQEAIKIAGKLLIDAGLIAEGYVDQCLEAAQNMGPYYVVCPGVALSHARPGDTVNQLCLATITMDPPIPFGHQYNDPVSILFMFGSLNQQSHLELLKNLGRILSNEAYLKKIIDADSFAELYGVIKSALEREGDRDVEGP